MDPKQKAAILDGIKDPTVRAHYEAQLDMAEDLGDIEVGGIFASPGSAGIFGSGGVHGVDVTGGRQFVKGPLDEAMHERVPAVTEPYVHVRDEAPLRPELPEPPATPIQDVPPPPLPPDLGISASASLVFLVLLVGLVIGLIARACAGAH